MTNIIISKQWVSTGYDPQYERKAFMADAPSPRFGDPDWVDALDPRILRILTGKIPYEEIFYKNEPITNLSDRYYMTTSLWWLILMFNGYIHPQDIPDGKRIRIPSLQFIRSKLDRNTNSERGKIVTI